MRDDASSDENVESTTRSPLSRALGAGAGAVLSLAVLAVVVVWAYRLGSQDAREVPVIRAAEGPNRIAPEDPGGVRFEHQGLAVYDSISGSDENADVALAPGAERPAADDQPMISRMEPGGIDSAPAAEQPEIASIGSVEPEPESPGATVLPDPVERAEPTEPEKEIKTTIFAPRKAPSPARRPGRIKAAAATRDEMAPARQAPRIPASTEAAIARAIAAAESPYQIQLGAFGSDKDAREQWTIVKGRNSDLLSGLELIVQPVESGGRTLFRMRAAPFEDRSSAVSICEALKSRGQACIVARSG